MDLPRITLFSTPLFATWVFDETHRILFDVGDGATALLDSKIHKIRLAALTHTHRDHCAGLMQLLNLRGGAGDFITVYPTGSGAARALSQFLSQFDSRSTGKVRWLPMGLEEPLAIEPDRHFLRAFETDHYPPVENARLRSLGYQVVRYVEKLKPDLHAMGQKELDAFRIQHGKSALTDTHEDILLSITGDTVPLHPDTFRGSRILMHECTFIESGETEEEEDAAANPHSCLGDVLKIAQQAEVGHLGLYHISRRYEDDYILARVKEECERINLACPVSVALPGHVYENFLAQTTWPGRV